MSRSPQADSVVQITSDPAEADQTVQVVGDQVITATSADAGKVVTVDDDGSLVLAEPGSDGGSSEYVEIDEVVLGSAATSISFSSIAATYKDLLIVGELRSDRANLIEDVYVRVGNGTVDAGSNYRYNRVGVLHSGSAFGSNAESAAQFFAGSVNAASADAGSFGPFEMAIMRYADAARWRHMTARADATSDATGMRAGLASGVWQNTADAIDIVTILPANGPNFVAGSYLTLYGRGTA